MGCCATVVIRFSVYIDTHQTVTNLSAQPSQLIHLDIPKITPLNLIIINFVTSTNVGLSVKKTLVKSVELYRSCVYRVH